MFSISIGKILSTENNPSGSASPARIQIHGRHTSYNVQKVLWLADELALEYAHFEAGGRFGGNDSGQFLSMNPHGKVPVLREGHRVVWESNTILRYLADTYGHGQWISAEPFDRTLVDRWLDWSIGRFEPAFVRVFWGYYRTPVELQDRSVIEAGVIECEACLESLSRQIAEKPYLTGELPTIADVTTGVFLFRLRAIDLDIAFPANVEKWYCRLTARRGYRRWVMSDFSELRGRTGY